MLSAKKSGEKTYDGVGGKVSEDISGNVTSRKFSDDIGGNVVDSGNKIPGT